jgi:hypothetical protein
VKNPWESAGVAIKKNEVAKFFDYGDPDPYTWTVKRHDDRQPQLLSMFLLTEQKLISDDPQWKSIEEYVPDSWQVTTYRKKKGKPVPSTAKLEKVKVTEDSFATGKARQTGQNPGYNQYDSK